MTKKILILGCSFTSGSYKKHYKENRESWEAPDKLVNNKSWWYYVDYFKDKDVTVFACPGHGYWSYYQILLFLNEKKLRYDEIWIQETKEPRAFLLDKKNIEHALLSAQVEINLPPFQIIVLSQEDHLSLSPWNAEKEILPYTIWLNSFFTDIVKMCSEKIDLLCKEKNVKAYVWSMYDSVMNCNYFTRLPLKYIRLELYNNNLLTGKTHLGCHQTEEGNKYIANLINENINTVS